MAAKNEEKTEDIFYANRLKNRIIAITGAYGGFGREMTKRITKEGAKVIAIGRDNDKLKQLQQEYNCEIVCADLSSTEGQNKIISQLIDLKADSLVNNAGVFKEGDCSDFTRDSYQKIMSVNLEAPLFISQGIANHWSKCNEESQTPKKYNIVNISSCASLSPLKGHILYGLSKSGMDYMTKHMALEYGEKGIQINSVNATVINSEMGTGPRGYWGNAFRRKWALDRIAKGRFGEVEEVVSITTYLLSNECHFIHGSNIALEGGLLCGSSNMKTSTQLLSNLDAEFITKEEIQQIKDELNELENKYDQFKK